MLPALAGSSRSVAVALHTNQAVKLCRYFSENSGQLPQILTNVMSAYFSNSALQTSPLIVTEYGRCVAPCMLDTAVVLA